MRKARRKTAMGLMVGFLGLWVPAMGWAAPPLIPSGADSGVELRRQQEEQARTRLAEELEAGPAAGGGAIDGGATAPTPETVPPLRFTLRTVTVDASAVLPADAADAASAPYLG